MKQRLISILLLLAMAFSLAACNAGGTTEPAEESLMAAEESQQEEDILDFSDDSSISEAPAEEQNSKLVDIIIDGDQQDPEELLNGLSDEMKAFFQPEDKIEILTEEPTFRYIEDQLTNKSDKDITVLENSRGFSECVSPIDPLGFEEENPAAKAVMYKGTDFLDVLKTGIIPEEYREQYVAVYNQANNAVTDVFFVTCYQSSNEWREFERWHYNEYGFVDRKEHRDISGLFSITYHCFSNPSQGRIETDVFTSGKKDEEPRLASIQLFNLKGFMIRAWSGDYHYPQLATFFRYAHDRYGNLVYLCHAYAEPENISDESIFEYEISDDGDFYRCTGYVQRFTESDDENGTHTYTEKAAEYTYNENDLCDGIKWTERSVTY